MRGKGILFLLGGLLAGLLLGAVVLFSGPGQPVGDQRRLPPTVGSPVGDFELPGLDGGSQRLSDLQSRPVVINFWATWCGPCREEMPLLDRIAAKHSADLVVLGVNYAESPEVVEAFVAEKSITFPVLLDETGLVAEQFFVRNYPTTFFIDAQGVLRAQHTGLLSEDLLARYLALVGIE